MATSEQAIGGRTAQHGEQGGEAADGIDSSVSAGQNGAASVLAGEQAHDSRVHARHVETSESPSGAPSAAQRALPDFKRLLRDAASAQLERQRGRATHKLGVAAGGLRHLTEELRRHQQKGLADYLEHHAQRFDSFASGLLTRDLDAVIRDAQGFARRRPAWFAAAAFGVGVALARLSRGAASPSAPGGLR